MSPAEACLELVQSSEVSQTAASSLENVPVIEQPRRRKLKVCRKPGAFSSQTRTYSRLNTREYGQTVKRKCSVTGEKMNESSQFKTTKRTKKYLEKPFSDPAKEKTRLNAINAKKNRDRKKQEMQVLSEQCDSLSEENRGLEQANRNLEARLQAAEEEIAFLRRALLGRVGSVKPDLADALKSESRGASAPAG